MQTCVGARGDKARFPRAGTLRRRRDGNGRSAQHASRLVGDVHADLIDRRRLSHEGDDPHCTAAAGTCERLNLDDLLEQDCPPAGGLRRRQPRREDDGGRRIGDDGIGLPPHARWATGIPVEIPRRDVAVVEDVNQHRRGEREQGKVWVPAVGPSDVRTRVLNRGDLGAPRPLRSGGMGAIPASLLEFPLGCNARSITGRPDSRTAGQVLVPFKVA